MALGVVLIRLRLRAIFRQDDFHRQIGDNTKDASEQLLSLIHLKRVGIYPENDSNFATIDYTIGEEITQYLIVVVVQESGDIDYITMES